MKKIIRKSLVELNTPNNQIRPAYLGKVFLAFVMATIVFLGIFALGYNFSYNKYRTVVQAQETMRYNLLSFEVEKELLGDSCENFDAHRFTQEMENMGDTLILLEERLGKTDSQVLEQKKTYSLLEARHLLYVMEHNTKCSDRIPIILFFYSNLGKYKDDADKLGYILSAVKSKKPGVMVYSFDYDLNSNLILLLKEKYNIDSPNRLVINGKTLLNVFDNIDQVLPYLN
jgi:hypothetical protein